MSMKDRMIESMKKKRERWLELSKDLTLYDKYWKYSDKPVANCGLRHRLPVNVFAGVRRKK